MKEITTMLTVQMTFIDNLTDEQVEDYFKHKDEAFRGLAEVIKMNVNLDDIQLVDCKDFIRDVKEDGEDV